MPIIAEAEAIAAARAYADGRAYPAWLDASVRTARVVVEGRDCWRVAARDAPRDGEPDWFDVYDGGQSYLVDVSTGECIGVGLLNGYRLFGTERRT